MGGLTASVHSTYRENGRQGVFSGGMLCTSTSKNVKCRRGAAVVSSLSSIHNCPQSHYQMSQLLERILISKNPSMVSRYIY